MTTKEGLDLAVEFYTGNINSALEKLDILEDYEYLLCLEQMELWQLKLKQSLRRKEQPWLHSTGKNIKTP